MHARKTRRTKAGRIGPEEESAKSSSNSKSVLLPALLSAFGLWLSFAPVGFGWLAWIAPVGWLIVVKAPEKFGAKTYFLLWLSGCAFWLPILQGIRLAFWPLYFGWLALSLYLAVYIPLFVWLTRSLIARRASLLVAAPVTWVGLEFIRSYVMTGFCANMLGHSQAHFPMAIQLADQFGVYGVSFVMMLVAAGGLEVFWNRKLGASQWLMRLAIVVGVLVANFGYGAFRLQEANALYAERPSTMTVALIQENTPTMYDMPENDDGTARKAAWMRYLNATSEVASGQENLGLIVWPESTFTATSPWVEGGVPDSLGAELAEADLDLEDVRSWIENLAGEFDFKTNMILQAVAKTSDTDLPPDLLLGCDTVTYASGSVQRFNSAIFAGGAGQPTSAYKKMHLVMFGEYFPFGEIFPFSWLREQFGLLVDPGDEPMCFQVGDAWVAPNICFESMMPRVISGQVRALTRQGKEPDVLVNLTNDSWFHGSSMLDHHLACSILCAVENRRPMLVAANSGISAEIDGCGRVLQILGKMATGGLLAAPHTDSRSGLVQSYGYPFAFLMALIIGCVGIVDLVKVLRQRSAVQKAG